MIVELASSGKGGLSFFSLKHLAVLDLCREIDEDGFVIDSLFSDGMSLYVDLAIHVIFMICGFFFITSLLWD